MKREALLGFAAAFLLLACQSAPTSQPPQLAPFTTDVCSWSPDAPFGVDISDICLAHDVAYHKGGSEELRLAVDMEFREGIAARGLPAYARFAYRMVRIGGHPSNPLGHLGGYQWGYGWSDQWGYP